MQDLEYVYGAFADIAESFDEEVPCEIDGHGTNDLLSVIHTDTAVEWREIFSCPLCGDPIELLVCDGVHRFILGKVIDKDCTRVVDCKCGNNGTLGDHYVRSVRV